jgi:hypothetical protein
MKYIQRKNFKKEKTLFASFLFKSVAIHEAPRMGQNLMITLISSKKLRVYKIMAHLGSAEFIENLLSLYGC